MLHTKEEYKKALEASAVNAEGWSTNTDSSCASTYKCERTGYEWPANQFALSLGYKDRDPTLDITVDRDVLVSISRDIGILPSDQSYEFLHIIDNIVKRELNKDIDYTSYCNNKRQGKIVAKALRSFASKL